jgi:hypothetical protein
MNTSIRAKCVNHMNVVLENFDASVKHFKEVYGAEFVVDIPQREMHACLVEFGRVIFELFVPHEFLLNSRYGAHYVGIEYCAELEASRKAVAERRMRIVRDIGIAIHTHPADAFGVSFEFTEHTFHERPWPALGGPIKSLSYWRDEHPLGSAGLKAYTVAVYDVAAASEFFQSFLSGEVIYDEVRADIGARAVGLQTCDAVMELLTPTGEGALLRHLHTHNQGIFSTVVRVRDLGQARRYFAERGIETVAGSMPGRFMIPAKANLGVIIEFQE